MSIRFARDRDRPFLVAPASIRPGPPIARQAAGVSDDQVLPRLTYPLSLKYPTHSRALPYCVVSSLLLPHVDPNTAQHHRHEQTKGTISELGEQILDLYSSH